MKLGGVGKRGKLGREKRLERSRVGVKCGGKTRKEMEVVKA